ncbi:MAG: hypothetical protein ACRDL5_11240 [Solirubrobacteraceae bacterium]
MGRRSLAGMLHLLGRGDAIRAGCIAALIAAICWYFGADVWHAILLGCAITVAAIAANSAGLSVPQPGALGWRPSGPARRAGARDEVATLSGSLRAGWGYVGLTAERRLSQIARRRMALEGLDLRNPEHRLAIERRIGEPAYRSLVNNGSRRLRLRTVVYCLDALDAVDASHYPAPQPRSLRRGPSLIGSRPWRTRER